jgi:hypothetical protein
LILILAFLLCFFILALRHTLVDEVVLVTFVDVYYILFELLWLLLDIREVQNGHVLRLALLATDTLVLLDLLHLYHLGSEFLNILREGIAITLVVLSGRVHQIFIVQLVILVAIHDLLDILLVALVRLLSYILLLVFLPSVFSDLLGEEPLVTGGFLVAHSMLTFR